MASAFLLNLEKLDSCLEAKVREAKIEAEAAAYFERSNWPTYAFYLSGVNSEVNKDDISLHLLKIQHFEEAAASELRLRYQRASIIFLPFSDAPRFQNGSTLEAWKTELGGPYEALYVQGEFLKGDAEIFRNYGVAIRSR